MRQLYLFLSFFMALLLPTVTVSAQSWPVNINLPDGDRLKLYEPQPTSFKGGELDFQSAVAYFRKDSDEPVFGTLWAKAQTKDQGSYQRFLRMTVSAMKFPAEIDASSTGKISRDLEEAIGKEQVMISQDQLNKNLKLQEEKEKLAGNINNQPPKLVYRDKPALMVIIDGNPIWKKNESWGVEAVVNSPNTIVRHSNGKIYIYGGNYWYEGANLSQTFSYASNPPSNLNQIAKQLKEQTEKENTSNEKGFDSEFDEVEEPGPVAEVLVSTSPAELIQSRGEAAFQPIASTNLLYVDNSPNDIFLDVSSQQYYVLLSGRWYRSSSLKGTWQFIPSEQLPSDFAAIPAGSPKDNVLASVAGTPAAQNALLDASIPQTAKVDRKSATANVEYDGDPEFQSISGTSLDYATNTNATVLKSNRRYYLVDNGVWFQSASANGPWVASTVRPEEVDLIPANYPVYNAKYVYIYDVSPDYIYMGYTPGYLNTYIYGPTVVYGTGYYYRPWYRHYYFPRPYTWGFNMHYTPWYGWSIGFNYHPGWFNIGWGYSRPWNYWHGGWWGPSVYRPAYCAPRYRHYGYYGYRNNIFIVNNRFYGNNYRNYRYNNVYRSRPAITTRDNRRYYGNTAGRNYNNRNSPNGSPAVRPNREYYGNNRNRTYNNNNRNNNNPGRINPNSPNRNNNGDRANRPDRTYRPGNSNRAENQPGQRPVTRPNNPERSERSGRPQISRQEQRTQNRPQIRRESTPPRSSGSQGQRGGSQQQRGNGGVSRPERRGN